ncbi:hypothetical protein PENTCL1PPCAC_19638, partial [Pristionchus entomophagus]
INQSIYQLTGSSQFHREVYNLIKDFDIGTLSLYFKVSKYLKIILFSSQNKDMKREMMEEESFVLDSVRLCKVVYMSLDNVAPKTIHEVYKMIVGGSTKLRQLRDHYMEKEKCIAFLQLIGISYRYGKFFSNRAIE